jgi:hypothetical protein
VSKDASKVYLKAAELIAATIDRPTHYVEKLSHMGCTCFAIKSAMRSGDFYGNIPEVIAYQAVMRPAYKGDDGDPLWWNGEHTKENQECRTWALLFAAEMARTGDL